MCSNIILLFDVEKLLYSTQTKSYSGKFFQYMRELLWEGQELDYNTIINAYQMALSTMTILTADPKDKYSWSPELSVIASHKAAGKILIVLYWNEFNNRMCKINRIIQSKLYRSGTPENFIIELHGCAREFVLEGCLKEFGWSPYNTSLIEFQNGGRMKIPGAVTLKSNEN